MSLMQGDARLILAECKKRGLLRNQAAYVLATAWHESAHTMKPIRERGGEAYLRAKPYYPYVGMGYVQLTWKANYLKATQKLGIDFVNHPKRLLEPRFAVPILVVGMQEGWFTGKKLADYITLKRSDFRNARKIVNGMDRADTIAGHARAYDAILRAEGYGEGANTESAPEKPAAPVNRDKLGKPAPKGLLGAILAVIAAVVGVIGKKEGWW